MKGGWTQQSIIRLLGVGILVLGLSTPTFAQGMPEAPPGGLDVNVLNTVDTNTVVTNDENNPVPVVVQEITKEIVLATTESLPSVPVGELVKFLWQREGGSFRDVPAWQVLAITDILISFNSGDFLGSGHPHPDINVATFQVGLGFVDSAGQGRTLMSISSADGQPFSHSFGSPILVKGGESFTLRSWVPFWKDERSDNSNTRVLLMGYLTPVAP